MAAKGKIVYYGYAPKTRVGPLFVAVNDRGLVALDFGLSEQEFVARVSHRTKATLIYRRTKNLRAVQLLLGHSKLESTVRYLGIEVDEEAVKGESFRFWEAPHLRRRDGSYTNW